MAAPLWGAAPGKIPNRPDSVRPLQGEEDVPVPESIDDLRAEVRALQRKLNNIARGDDTAADWFSINETAKRWRVSVSTVRRFEREGRIEFRKFSTPNGKN